MLRAFCGAKYCINGWLYRPSFAEAHNSFNESTQVTRRRQLYHHGFPGFGLCTRHHHRAHFRCRNGHDAFFIAFKLPNLLRRIFAEGAFSQAFVPILAEYKSQQGEEATRTFISYVTGLLTLALALVTLLG